MKYRKILITLIVVTSCLFISASSICQTTTPAQQEQIRKSREAQEARNRQAQQEQEKERQRKAANPGDRQNNTVGTTQKTSTPPPADSKNHFLSAKADANGLFLKMEWGKWGLVDKAGREIVPVKYDDVRPTTGSRYAIKLNNKWGFFNKSGVLIIGIGYDYIYKDFENGEAQVIVDKLMWSINEEGNQIAGTKETSPYERQAQYDRAKAEIIKAEEKSVADKNYQLGIKSQDLNKWQEALDYYKLAGYPVSPVSSEINLRGSICVIELEMMNPSWPKSLVSTPDYGPIGIFHNYLSNGGKDLLMYYYGGVAYSKYDLQLKDGSSIPPASNNRWALNYFKEFETKAPVSLQEKTRINKYLGDCYYIKEDFSNALFYYLKDVKLFTQDWRTSNRIIECYLSKQDVAKAGDYLKSVINVIPSNDKAGSFNNMAYAFAKNEDYTNALAYVEIAVNANLKSDNPSMKIHYYLFTRAYIYYKMAKYEDAVTELSNLVNNKDTFKEAYYFRGKAFAALGKLQEACSDWSKLEGNHPKRESIVTEKDFEDAWGTCSKKMRKSLKK